MATSAGRPAVPPAPEALDPDAAARLEQIARDALVAQRRDADDAIDRALRHVPRLLRAPVRRILGA